MAFLMVFHQLSLSGAWLIRTNFSPAAGATPGVPVRPTTANAATASARNLDFMVFLLSRRAPGPIGAQANGFGSKPGIFGNRI